MTREITVYPGVWFVPAHELRNLGVMTMFQAGAVVVDLDTWSDLMSDLNAGYTWAEAPLTAGEPKEAGQ